jgi:hypothetical protein
MTISEYENCRADRRRHRIERTLEI